MKKVTKYVDVQSKVSRIEKTKTKTKMSSIMGGQSGTSFLSASTSPRSHAPARAHARVRVRVPVPAPARARVPAPADAPSHAHPPYHGHQTPLVAYEPNP